MGNLDKLLEELRYFKQDEIRSLVDAEEKADKKIKELNDRKEAIANEEREIWDKLENLQKPYRERSRKLNDELSKDMIDLKLKVIIDSKNKSVLIQTFKKKKYA